MITAGPTWVALDRVRVISNLATGETGCILANQFKKLGAKVTLLLGPGNFSDLPAGIRLRRFRYFAELAQLFAKELKNQKFTAVIQAAAVADYRPQAVIYRKVSSKRASWKINLVPTQKLIKKLRIYQPDLFTVGFKFQPDADKVKLIKEGRRLLTEANLNLVVANSNQRGGYQAYILDGLNISGPCYTKTKMATYLARLMRI